MLDLLESREKRVLVQWLEAGKASGLLASLEEVTCDMWDGYAQAPKDVFGPSIRITIDRFHVMRYFQDRLNEAQRNLQRLVGRNQSAELKGSRWLWLTNPENLTPEKRVELNALKRKFPLIGKLADHREALRRIFEDRQITTAEAAIQRMKQWCQQGEQLGFYAVTLFNKTIHAWMQEICNYFVSRSSNGRTEGFNRGLRSILWRACGMRNFAHFRMRVLHQFG